MIEALNRHNDAYAELTAIQSHQIGDMLYDDYVLRFDSKTTYAEISALQYALAEEVKASCGKCRVSIVIDDLIE